MTSQTRYRAAPATDLMVRALDDITLIYHRPSSQTHMVASPVPEILDALLLAPLPERGGSNAAEILITLTTHFDLGDPATALPVITAHLEEMVALGLVHRA